MVAILMAIVSVVWIGFFFFIKWRLKTICWVIKRTAQGHETTLRVKLLNKLVYGLWLIMWICLNVFIYFFFK